MTWMMKSRKRSLKNTDGNKNNLVIKINPHKIEVDVIYHKAKKKLLTSP